MTTRSRTRAIGLAATLAAVVLTSACNDPKPPSTSTTTTSTASTASTTTMTAPTSLTPAEKDLNAAEETIGRYWNVLDQVAADPKKSLNQVATVARDQAAAQSRVVLSTYQAKGWTQIGRATVLTSKAVTKDGKTFAVTACVDVTKVNLVDAQGKSVVTPGRPDRQQYSYTVVKAPQGFFVTVDTLKGKPC